MENIKNKNILLAGATGTIGAAVAAMLHDAGAKIFITGRDAGKLAEVANRLKIPQEQTCTADFKNESSVTQLKDAYFKVFNTIDVLINVAGTGIIKPLENLSLAEFQTSLNANLVGPFLLVQHFLPAMKTEKKGLIINVPGVLGKVPMAGAAAYSASKYGLVGMMQSIREELKRTEIRITNLFLGGADTAFWDNIDLRVQKDKMIVAREAATAIVFLCRQPASGVVSEMVLQPFNHQAI